MRPALLTGPRRPDAPSLGTRCEVSLRQANEPDGAEIEGKGNGARSRIRTLDPRRVKAMLYH